MAAELVSTVWACAETWHLELGFKPSHYWDDSSVRGVSMYSAGTEISLLYEYLWNCHESGFMGMCKFGKVEAPLPEWHNSSYFLEGLFVQLSLPLWDFPDGMLSVNSGAKNVYVSYSEQALRDFGCPQCVA